MVDLLLVGGYATLCLFFLKSVQMIAYGYVFKLEITPSNDFSAKMMRNHGIHGDVFSGKIQVLYNYIFICLLNIYKYLKYTIASKWNPGGMY